MAKFLKKILGLNKNKIINDSQINFAGSGENTLKNNDWFSANYDEGQLSIDIYQTPDNLIVKSTIAGVKPEDIDISLHNDMLTVRGRREEIEKIGENDYLYKECFWGAFSRSVILPMEVNPKKIKAALENGILTIILPKIKTVKNIFIKVKEK